MTDLNMTAAVHASDVFQPVTKTDDGADSGVSWMQTAKLEYDSNTGNRRNNG